MMVNRGYLKHQIPVLMLASLIVDVICLTQIPIIYIYYVDFKIGLHNRDSKLRLERKKLSVSWFVPYTNEQ